MNCLQPQNTDPCIGEVKAQVTAEGITDKQAETYGEFIEQLSDYSQNQKLVVIAPHGGEIEKNTDKQAEIVGNQCSSEDVSLWICKGFDKGDKSAYERWHITSTEISEKSFPKFNTIFGRTFEYSIAFHGWTNNNICVGGRKNKTVDKLKVELKDAIQNTLREQGSNIQVNVSGCLECPEGFNGDSEDNIVNRLGKMVFKLNNEIWPVKNTIRILLTQLLKPSVLGSTCKCIWLYRSQSAISVLWNFNYLICIFSTSCRLFTFSLNLLNLSPVFIYN